MGEGADGAGDLPHADGLLGPPQPLQVSPRLGEPEGGLEPEHHGLGVNAVGAPDTEGFLVADGETAEGLPEALQTREEEIGGRDHLEGLRGVHHVGGGHADVHVAGICADRFLEGWSETR
jgi:hypothetical protein